MRIESKLKKILLVGDDGEIEEKLTSLLETRDYKLNSAKNGLEALNIIQENKDYPLIIIDYKIPDMNGQELAHKLKQIAKEIPIILMINKIDSIKRNGSADLYLSKSVEPITFVETVKKYIK